MRKPSYSVTLRNEYLLIRIKDIKGEHPFWGYRRVWAYLRPNSKQEACIQVNERT